MINCISSWCFKTCFDTIFLHPKMFDVSLEIINQMTRVWGRCLVQSKKDIKTIENGLNPRPQSLKFVFLALDQTRKSYIYNFSEYNWLEIPVDYVFGLKELGKEDNLILKQIVISMFFN